MNDHIPPGRFQLPAVVTDMVVTTGHVRVRTTVATERRLAAYIARSRSVDPDVWPDDESVEERMEFAAACLIEAGLDASEKEAGVIAKLDGRIIARTRQHRGKLRYRLRRAWRELTA